MCINRKGKNKYIHWNLKENLIILFHSFIKMKSNSVDEVFYMQNCRHNKSWCEFGKRENLRYGATATTRIDSKRERVCRCHLAIAIVFTWNDIRFGKGNCSSCSKTKNIRFFFFNDTRNDSMNKRQTSDTFCLCSVFRLFIYLLRI